MRWFERAEIEAAVPRRTIATTGARPGDPGGPLRLPPSLAIARRLIDALANGLRLQTPLAWLTLARK